MSHADEYPTVRLRRIEGGYTTHDGAYRVVRDTFASIAYCGCRKKCFHVYRVSPNIGETPVARFCETLREARLEIACDVENRRTT